MSILQMSHGLMSGVQQSGGDTFALLLNGITETETPSSGSLGATIQDSSCPVSVPVYSNLNMSDGVNFTGTEVSELLSGLTNEWTIDFWIKSSPTESASYDSSVYFFSISDTPMWNSSISGVISRYNGASYYILQIQNQQNSIYLNTWHHVAIVHTAGSSTVSYYLDGTLISSEPYVSVSSVMFRIRGNTGSNTGPTAHKFAQIAIRPRVVWTENFTPPTNIYTQA